MFFSWFTLLFFFCLSGNYCIGNVINTNLTEQSQEENLSIDAIPDENFIETFVSCPTGEKSLKCQKTEARRAVDCPQGDCFCNNCAAAGPNLWASCCRENSRCCSHLAAACRTCDHPTLYPFCMKHFKKCSTST